ncbi:hypothetical protein [Streptomyces sp. ISL-86]|uniref:hypothetical protein n=1 Tax=Streptomyces sp. ISL-86 TaxID=2819187 RepID=UPI001BE78395|nr:hypothetical protein [Streptomyces sp. ISL-86]MBT2459579.1 hypothetical protein [Streptomyces sp. ISL-86]
MLRFGAPTPELPVTLDMPGKGADFLRTAELDDAERPRSTTARPYGRGQGYTLRVSAPPSVYCQLLDHCQSLDGAQGTPGIPAQRKARREYENRVNALVADTLS